MQLTFCCRSDNDLYAVLTATGAAPPLYPNLDEALDAAPSGTAVLVLADEYPRPDITVTERHLALARERSLRLLLEYPAAVAGVDLGAPCPTQWERAVVASDFFAPGLDKGSILALHGCWYLPAEVSSPHLVAARVAGYRTAVYGLPDTAHPLLFELSGQPALVACTKLSQFRTARYAPEAAWQQIWRTLLQYLCPADQVPELSWQPAVRASMLPAKALPEDAETRAFERSVRWFRDQAVYSIDWKKGVIEGFEAAIDHRGRQLRRTWTRGDCIAESAMVFAWDSALRRDPASKQRAGQLLDYVFSSPDFFHQDPADPAYGLTNWFERGHVFYGDDNARVLLPALVTSRLLGEGRWDERILKCVLANLRTTGPLGFRKPCIHQADFDQHGGWRAFHEKEHIQYAPHYQAYLWAVLLWVHALTGDAALLRMPRHAMGMTMAAYPDQWRWTNGMAQELARMLLPLSFLIRVDDTSEHRAWLHRIATDLLALMQPCGAIRELLGPAGQGSYGPPASNEAYGTNEATLIQSNGDPACDLLYTTNYAFLGLHEAAAATGDPALQGAADQLADFLCRIQVQSTDRPELHGAWMRSFDYELWEYWGSSADAGWGAWSVESGWTNTWIASVLAMRVQGTQLFDLSLAPRLQEVYYPIRQEMLAGTAHAEQQAASRPTEAPGAG